MIIGSMTKTVNEYLSTCYVVMSHLIVVIVEDVVSSIPSYD